MKKHAEETLQDIKHEALGVLQLNLYILYDLSISILCAKSTIIGFLLDSLHVFKKNDVKAGSPSIFKW